MDGEDWESAITEAKAVRQLPGKYPSILNISRTGHVALM